MAVIVIQSVPNEMANGLYERQPGCIMYYGNIKVDREDRLEYEQYDRQSYKQKLKGYVLL